MSSETIAVGIVGVGRMGRLHAQAYQRLPGVRLAAVCDRLPERARAVAEATGARVVEDARALAREVQAASVAVPTQSHTEVALELIERGIDVLVEKPLAPSSADARRIVDAAARHKTLLMVGHSERFNPAVRAVAPLISRPGFVEVHRLAPFTERGTDVDVVLDLMIHDLDLVLHFVGSDVESIDAVGVPVMTGGIDIANARIRFRSGAVANLTASRISLERMRKIRLFEPDLYVTLDTANRSAKAYRLLREGARPEVAEVELGVDPTAEPLDAELAAFVAAIRSRQEPSVSGAQALAALELAERIRSAIDRAPVRPGA